MVWSSQSEGGLRRWPPAIYGDGEGPRARAAGGTSRGWRGLLDTPWTLGMALLWWPSKAVREPPTALAAKGE